MDTNKLMDGSPVKAAIKLHVKGLIVFYLG